MRVTNASWYDTSNSLVATFFLKVKIFLKLILKVTVAFYILSFILSGEGSGNPLQDSCLENSMDRGAWCAAVYGVLQSQTWLITHIHTKWSPPRGPSQASPATTGMLSSHKCPAAGLLSSPAQEHCLSRESSVWSGGQDSWLPIQGHGKKTEENSFKATGWRRVY